MKSILEALEKAKTKIKKEYLSESAHYVDIHVKIANIYNYVNAKQDSLTFDDFQFIDLGLYNLFNHVKGVRSAINKIRRKKGLQ
jgi:hypothetical protein